MKQQFKDLIVDHVNLSRHWCPLSQPYAGVDALLSFLNSGWMIVDDIGCDERWIGGTRRILIYHFVLTNQEDVISMPVLRNPVLDRLLKQLCQPGISVVSKEQGVDIEAGKHFHKHDEPCPSDTWSMS